MSHFLKLSNMLINTRHIFIVNVYKGKYQIKLNSEYPDMKGFWLCGSGILKSGTTQVNIDEKEDPKDYKIVTEWIQQQ